MTNLIGPEWVEDGELYTQIIFDRLVRWWNVKIIHQFEESAIIEYKQHWYLLTDNGGEINIWYINRADRIPSIPTVANPAIDTDTTAWRIMEAIKGRQIDWKYRLDVPYGIPDGLERTNIV